MADRDWAAYWQECWELCQKATPGPWEEPQNQYGFIYSPDTGLWITNCNIANSRAPLSRVIHDAKFIAEARSALPAWLERVKELEDALRLAYRALAEGMADVPSGKRYRLCSQLRAEAKQKIREVLWVGETG